MGTERARTDRVTRDGPRTRRRTPSGRARGALQAEAAPPDACRSRRPAVCQALGRACSALIPRVRGRSTAPRLAQRSPRALAPRPEARSLRPSDKVGRSQLYSRGKWVSKCPSNVTRVEAASGWEEHLRVYKGGARGAPRGGVQSLYLHHKSLSAQLSCEE